MNIIFVIIIVVIVIVCINGYLKVTKESKMYLDEAKTIHRQATETMKLLHKRTEELAVYERRLTQRLHTGKAGELRQLKSCIDSTSRDIVKLRNKISGDLGRMEYIYHELKEHDWLDSVDDRCMDVKDMCRQLQEELDKP